MSNNQMLDDGLFVLTHSQANPTKSAFVCVAINKRGDKWSPRGLNSKHEAEHEPISKIKPIKKIGSVVPY